MSVCLFVCLSVSLSTCLPVYLSTCLPVYLSTCLPVYLSTCLPVYLSTCLSISLSISLSIYLSICLSVCLSVYLSICLSVSLSVCLSICLSVYLPTYLPCVYLSTLCLSIDRLIDQSYLWSWRSNCARLASKVAVDSCKTKQFSARLPHKMEGRGPKTTKFCETSSVFEVGNIKNEAILRDFFQKWRI